MGGTVSSGGTAGFKPQKPAGQTGRPRFNIFKTLSLMAESIRNSREAARYYFNLGRKWAEKQPLESFGYEDGFHAGMVPNRTLRRGMRRDAVQRAYKALAPQLDTIAYYCETETELYETLAPFTRGALSVFNSQYADGLRDGVRERRLQLQNL